MKILKFGGSSVGSPERIKSIIAITTDTKRYAPGEIRGIVVSAFQGVTDSLIALAQQATAHNDTYRENLKALERRHIEALESLIPVADRSKAIATVKATMNELEDLLQG